MRFAASPEDYANPPGPWNEPRLLYLQHASDPVVWWYWSILWSRPDWLAEPRGPDVNPRSIWFPYVSFWQVTVDQFHGTGVPNGHGHNYGNMMVSAWAQLARPPGWTGRGDGPPAEADRWLRDRVAGRGRGARARRRRGRPRLRRARQPGGPERALRAGQPGRGRRGGRRGPRPRGRAGATSGSPATASRPASGSAASRSSPSPPPSRSASRSRGRATSSATRPSSNASTAEAALHAAAAHPLRHGAGRGADLPRRAPRPLPAAAPAVGRGSA